MSMSLKLKKLIDWIGERQSLGRLEAFGKLRHHGRSRARVYISNAVLHDVFGIHFMGCHDGEPRFFRGKPCEALIALACRIMRSGDCAVLWPYDGFTYRLTSSSYSDGGLEQSAHCSVTFELTAYLPDDVTTTTIAAGFLLIVDPNIGGPPVLSIQIRRVNDPFDFKLY